MSEYRRLGGILVERGYLSEHELEKTLEMKANSSARFGELVVQLGYASEWEVAKCLAEQFDLEIVNPDELQPSSRALQIVPAVFALRRSVLPYRLTATELHCALADPIDVGTCDQLAQSTGKLVRIVLAPESALQAAIARAYALPQAVTAQVGIGPPRRKRKIDPQSDRAALLDALMKSRSMGRAG